MPGMNSGLNPSDPTVVAAFKAALLHQGLIALLIFLVVGLAWLGLRAWLPSGAAGGILGAAPALAEPAWRRLLRIGFGLIWILDGILQAQPKMAVGLPSQVIEPIAATSPRWVQEVVNWAGTNWSYHPMQAGASAVWIQIGIGIWMMVAARGPLSRLAGLVSIGWGLVVWAFGESFGGIFAPGLTWLFGAPGAVLIYAVAGALIALPERTWRTGRLGRLTLAGSGLFLLGMAVLQAWPGRGFWQGTAHGQPGTPGDYDLCDGANTAAACPVRLDHRVHRLRRGARLRGQPVRRRRARRNRRGVPDRQAAADQAGAHRLHRAVPSRLGTDRGLRLPRRPGYRPQQHDPDGAHRHRRVSRPGSRADDGRQNQPPPRRPMPAGGTGPGWRWTAPGRRLCASRLRPRASSPWPLLARSA